MTDELNPDVQEILDETDDGMVMDLSDVDEDGPDFEPIPAGVVDAIVENTEYKKSQSGNPMIVWTFKVTEPDYQGRYLFYHTVLNKQFGISRLKRVLVRVAPDVEFKGFNPKQFCEEGKALGLPARLKISVGTYDGKPTNDVKDVLAPSEGSDFLDG